MLICKEFSKSLERAIENADTNIIDLRRIIDEILSAKQDDSVAEKLLSSSSQLIYKLSRSISSCRVDHVESSRLKERLQGMHVCGEALLAMTLFFGASPSTFKNLFDKYHTFFLQNLPRIAMIKDIYTSFTLSVCMTMTSSMKLTSYGLVVNPLIGKHSHFENSCSVGSISRSVVEVVNSLYKEVGTSNLEPAAEAIAYELLNILSTCIGLFEAKKNEQSETCLDLILTAVSTKKSPNNIIPECTGANVFGSLLRLCAHPVTSDTYGILTAKSIQAVVHDIFTNTPQVLYKMFEFEKNSFESESTRTSPMIHESFFSPQVSWSFDPPIQPLVNGSATTHLLMLCRISHSLLQNTPRNGLHILSLNEHVHSYMHKYILYFIEDCFFSEYPLCVIYGNQLLALYYAFLSECIQDTSTATEVFSFLKRFCSKEDILSLTNVINNISQEALATGTDQNDSMIPKINFLARVQAFDMSVERKSSAKLHLTPKTLLCSSFFRLIEVLTIHLSCDSVALDDLNLLGLQEMAVRFLAFATDDIVLCSTLTYLAALARQPTVAHSILQSINELRLLHVDATKCLQHALCVDEIIPRPLKDMLSEMSVELEAGSYLRTVGYLALVRWVLVAYNRSRAFSFAESIEVKEDFQWHLISEKLPMLVQCIFSTFEHIKQHALRTPILTDGMWVVLSLSCTIAIEILEHHPRLIDWAEFLSEAESLVLVYRGVKRTSIHADRGIRSILLIIIGCMEKLDGPETKERIFADFSRNINFLSLCIDLLGSADAFLRYVASKCFFYLMRLKNYDIRAVAQWRVQGSEFRIAEKIQRYMFVKPESCTTFDNMYALAPKSENQSFSHSSTNFDSIGKQYTIREVLRLRSEESPLAELAFLSAGPERHTLDPVLASLNIITDTYVWYFHPDFYTSCLEMFYSLINSHNKLEKLGSVLDRGSSIIVNALSSYKTLTPLQFGWFLHLGSVYIDTDRIDHRFLPDFSDHILLLAEQIPVVDGRFVKFLPENPHGDDVRYDLPFLDMKVLPRCSGELQKNLLEVLDDQNRVLTIAGHFLVILRGWAMLVRSIFNRNRDWLPQQSLCLRYLSLFWHGMSTLSKKTNLLPASSSIRRFVAHVLCDFLATLRRNGVLFKILRDEGDIFTHEICQCLNRWEGDPSSQGIAAEFIVILLEKTAARDDYQFMVTSDLVRGLVKVAEEEYTPPKEHFFVVLKALESIMTYHGTHWSLIDESGCSAMVSRKWDLLQAGLSLSIQSAISEDRTPDKELRPFSTGLIALCGFYDAMTEKLARRSNFVFYSNLHEWIRNSELFQLMQTNEFHQILESRSDFRECIFSHLYPMYRLLVIIAKAVIITSGDRRILLELTDMMIVLKDFNSIAIRFASQPNLGEAYENIQREVVTLFVLLQQSGPKHDSVVSIIDPPDFNSILRGLAQPQSWNTRTIHNNIPFVSVVTQALSYLWKAKRNSEKNHLNFCLQFHLVRIAHQLTSMLISPARLPAVTCSDTRTLLIESIVRALYVISPAFKAHPVFRKENIKAYDAKIRSDNVLSYERFQLDDEIDIQAFTEEEQFVILGHAIRQYCQTILEMKSFTLHDHDDGDDAMSVLRSLFQHLITEHMP